MDTVFCVFAVSFACLLTFCILSLSFLRKSHWKGEEYVQKHLRTFCLCKTCKPHTLACMHCEYLLLGKLMSMSWWYAAQRLSFEWAKILAKFFKGSSSCLNKMMPTWNAKYFPKLFLGFDCNLGRGCPWAGSKRPLCPSPQSSRSGIAGCHSPRPACPVWHQDMINCPSKLSPSIQIITRIIKIYCIDQGHHVLPCQNFGDQKVICIITQARMEQSFR